MQPSHYRRDLIFAQTLSSDKAVELQAIHPEHPPFRIKVDYVTKHAFAVFENEIDASFFDDTLPEIFCGFEQVEEAFFLGRLH